MRGHGGERAGWDGTAKHTGFARRRQRQLILIRRLKHKLHVAMERRLPEKRLFLRTDTETRFVRLGPGTQLIALAGSSALVAWTIIATAILLMDSIGSGNFREQAKREQQIYQERLNVLSSARDSRAEEAVAAQERFNTALTQISRMQSQLLASEERRKELERGLEVVQSTLRRSMQEREQARDQVVELTAAIEGNGSAPAAGVNQDVQNTLAYLTSALADTASQRDEMEIAAALALQAADAKELELRLTQERNDQIFRQLEEAMTVSVKPLDRMFRNAGINTDNVIDQVRRGYSGRGGPLTPIAFSTKGLLPDGDTARANNILTELDRMNLYRIAVQKVPFARPVGNNVRFTSGYGPRWGRMHYGADFAAAPGTPIYSTADGVVTFAGWQSGYGRLVKIQHEFGIETRYAHQSKIRVKVGQRVSRGDRIGDIGSSGRSTGPHLHYEVRVGGKAQNPMNYIKAARDVF